MSKEKTRKSGMWRYFVYEFKKNLWAFLIITALCLIPYVAQLSTMDLRYRVVDWTEDGEPFWRTYYICDPNLSYIFGALILLCFIVPMLTYSFKMNKRGVDGYYSLPLRKEKLYLVKTLVGLFLVLAPFTIAYWGGFLTLLCRKGNPYDMVWYVPAYFGFLVLAVFTYGINAFVFVRANRVWDGLVFMLAYAVMGLVLVSFVEDVFNVTIRYHHEQNFSTWGGMLSFCENMTDYILGKKADWSPWIFVYPMVVGGAAWILFFSLLRFEKGESAEQTSDSWFGYRILIPFYTAMLVGMNSINVVNIGLAAVASIVATVVYRHKFRFHWKYWIMIGIGVFVGILFSVLLH